MLPEAICPYSPTLAGQAACTGLAQARARNPLRFNLSAAEAFYEPLDMKRALKSAGHVLTLGLPMVVIEYLLPCTRATARAHADTVRTAQDR